MRGELSRAIFSWCFFKSRDFEIAGEVGGEWCTRGRRVHVSLSSVRWAPLPSCNIAQEELAVFGCLGCLSWLRHSLVPQETQAVVPRNEQAILRGTINALRSDTELTSKPDLVFSEWISVKKPLPSIKYVNPELALRPVGRGNVAELSSFRRQFGSFSLVYITTR